MNLVSLIGRLGKDPESRTTGSGKAVANFSLAVDRGYGDKKTTSWIPIVAWEKTAETAEKYLTKGSQVAIEGTLSQRSWTDKSGNTRSTLEVIANRIDFLSKSEKKQDSGGEFDDTVPDEEIPF